MRIEIPKHKNVKTLNYKYLDSTVEQYYKPFIRGPMIKRLELAVKLIGEGREKKILDIGFGGGTFFPELSKRCDELFGIDVHPEMDNVKSMLEKENIKATISQDSILDISYPDGFFSCIVCMSVLEHITGEDLKRAVSELYRVLDEKGKCIIGVPVKNKITDSIIYHVLKFKPDEIHPTSHTDAVKAFEKNFVLDQEIHYPFWLPLDFSLYAVYLLRKNSL